MSVYETVTSPVTPGAGRSLDAAWPGPLNRFAVAGGNWFARIGAQTNGTYVWVQTVTGTGPAPAYAAAGPIAGSAVPNVSFGVSALINTGTSWRNGDVASIRPRLFKGFNIIPLCDDWACWRAYANMAFGGTPAANCDYGWQLLFPATNLDQHIILNNVPGIGWTRLASGSVAVVINGPLGLQTFPFAPGGFDPTAFHSYEFRVTSATLLLDAVLEAWVDGQRFMSWSWAAGTILPSYNAAYPATLATLVNYAGVAGATLNVHTVRTIAAPAVMWL